jgi:adenine/guanine phosphoribosyltransferase-like PRPP-binding protein
MCRKAFTGVDRRSDLNSEPDLNSEVAEINGVRFGLAPRLNTDTRSYKILMDVAGDSMSYAIEPARLRRAASSLCAAFNLDEKPDCVLGLAPGGIALAIAVAFELDIKAVIAYKTKLGLDHEVRFTEPHAQNSQFYLYGVQQGTSVVVVDDEIDSGNTLLDCIGALRRAGARVLTVATAVEGLHHGKSEGRQQLESAGATLVTIARIEVGDRR